MKDNIEINNLKKELKTTNSLLITIIIAFFSAFALIIVLSFTIERASGDGLCTLLSNGEYTDYTQTKPDYVNSITCRDKNTNEHKRIFFNELIVYKKTFFNAIMVLNKYE